MYHIFLIYFPVEGICPLVGICPKNASSYHEDSFSTVVIVSLFTIDRNCKQHWLAYILNIRITWSFKIHYSILLTIFHSKNSLFCVANKWKRIFLVNFLESTGIVEIIISMWIHVHVSRRYEYKCPTWSISLSFFWV